jgi:hypothetical protein
MILSGIMAASGHQLRAARPASQLHGAVAENVHLRAGAREGSYRDRHISNAIPDEPQADWALRRLRTSGVVRDILICRICGWSQRPRLRPAA